MNKNELLAAIASFPDDAIIILDPRSKSGDGKAQDLADSIGMVSVDAVSCDDGAIFLSFYIDAE
jgi:hypothetical protein